MRVAAAPVDRDRAYESLERSLESEVTLLAELSAGLAAQRQAIAGDDTGTLEQLAQQLSRTLLTLREARRQRLVLLEMVAGQPDVRLAGLLDGVPGPLAERIRGASGRLHQAALAVHRDLQINQSVIRRSIESGERLLQHLLSSPTPEAYGPGVDRDRGAMLLNQRA